ncbi:RDD family protein [Thermomonas sp. HDW16]|uniref:RDD family protein n=1 Tax=Thermomonas sp. HDW16 TaxID=2714945 RepID=UPI00140A0288|nr:RDD family protein [Thermomonas sp. HDW16]QIL19510.1 RDD family protein [Thermomonas sp. HDW16]
MATTPAEHSLHAGFWARYAAWSLDAALLLPLIALLGTARISHACAEARNALHVLAGEMPRLLGEVLGAQQATAGMATQLLNDPVMASAINRLDASLGAILFTPLLLYVVLALPWAVLFEQSRWQATPGMRAFGLRVTDAQGRRLKAGHALQRHLAAGLSWLTLNIGHAMALLPPQHLAMHDRVSDTRVLRREQSNPLSGLAKAWLTAQALVAVIAFGGLFLWLQAAMQAAMQQTLGF